MIKPKLTGVLLALAGLLLIGSPSLAKSTSLRQVLTRTPTHDVTYTISDQVPQISAKTPNTDPDLKPGFPVQTYETSGSYHAGPAINTVVANIDADPEQEIIITALASGPLYAFNYDGSPVPGWPVSGGFGAGYPAVGKTSTGPGVYAAYYGRRIGIYNGAGVFLPGWPQTTFNYIATPPALADVNGDGQDELFVEQEDWCLHAYRTDGTILPGWPVCNSLGGQELHTPAIADIDNNPANGLEIVTASGSSTPGIYLFAYHANGTLVTGFPVNINPTGYGLPDTFPVIGDVDGDGQLEIVVINKPIGNPFQLRIYTGTGSLKRVINSTSDNLWYGTAPALADLDCDNSPEIIVQSDDAVYAWKGDGTVFPGWPQTIGTGFRAGNSSPVVGDIDGDGYPDVAVTFYDAYGAGQNTHVRAYNRNGVLLARFPKYVREIGDGAVPAIADIDLDGRNDLVVTGSYWDGISGMKNRVWAYDLRGKTYGHVQWGQFGGDAKHTNFYEPPKFMSPECFRK